jgi:hypothetical protein
MPRRSGGGRSGGGFRGSGGGLGRSGGGGYRNYSTSRSSSSGPRYSRPVNQPHTTTMPMQRPGMGLGSALATGVAFGSGAALAHNIVGGMMGHRTGHEGLVEPAYNTSQPMTGEQNNMTEMNEQQAKSEPQQNPCMDFSTKFVQCLQANSNDIYKCQNIFDDLKVCERNLI